FDGITRLYSPRQVAEQQGSFSGDFTVAREAAEAFYLRLRELFEQRKQITTFGPYSPGQTVMMKRIGMEAIYHGGDAHVRNLIRRFVEVGVPGYHIEDQKPGAKKCGHQGGKVVVAEDEQIKRLNAARLQLDIMRVPGIIVARTDAESATFIESRSDERDQPFILGATSVGLPSYKAGYLAMLRKLFELGVEEVRGHLLFALSEAEYAAAFAWLERVGIMPMIVESAPALRD